MCGIFFYKGCLFTHDDVVKTVFGMNHRGPDNTTVVSKGDMTMVFWRLRINDTTEAGDQPFISDDKHYFMCNGEIYNHLELGQHDKCKSSSDCEDLFYLLKDSKHRHRVPDMLDGVFAYVFYDDVSKEVFVARDPYGVRGLFELTYYNINGDIEKMFASEMKMLYPFYERLMKINGIKHCQLTPFKPSTSYQFQFGTTYHYLDTYFRLPDIHKNIFLSKYMTSEMNEEMMMLKIREMFENGVRKRVMMSDREVGCFLSGGLDSSLVAGYAMKIRKELGHNEKFHTFSIGFPNSPDLYYARKVAEHIGSCHHEVVVGKDEILSYLPEIVRTGETVDITTIRASTWMYALSKYISKNTNVVVVLSGEGSDELTQGYLYFKNAPDADSADEESKRLLKELYYYDVLRADRMTAAHGLEVRVPFLDKEFTRFYLSIPSDMRYVRNGVEKYLLRKAFSGYDIIPEEIVWRKKEAFSDGVSLQTESWHTIIQNYVYQFRSEMEDMEIQDKGPVPQTDEARFIYYHFLKNYGMYPIYLNTPKYWLPQWVKYKNGVIDPSARTIDAYETKDGEDKKQ